MTRSKPINFVAAAALIPLAALTVAACGGSATGTAAPAPPRTTSGAPAAVRVAKTGLGNVLVDSHDRTL
jgi:hypothetical protein